MSTERLPEWEDVFCGAGVTVASKWIDRAKTDRFYCCMHLALLEFFRNLPAIFMLYKLNLFTIVRISEFNHLAIIPFQSKDILVVLLS